MSDPTLLPPDSMSEKICRWGILGTAGIARKNWQAIRHSGNGRTSLSQVALSTVLKPTSRRIRRRSRIIPLLEPSPGMRQ